MGKREAALEEEYFYRKVGFSILLVYRLIYFWKYFFFDF